MAQLHTGWHVNTKVLGVGLQGMGLHAWSISYCDHARSDGFIPSGAWPSLPGVGAAVKSLLTAGLWERAEGGFLLHDYRKYNRLREQIESEQQANNTRQSRHRSRVTEPVTNSVTNAVSHTVTPRAGAPNPNPGVNVLAGSLRSLGGVGDREQGLPIEVIERLSQPPIGERASQQASNFQSSNGSTDAC